jgi:hypothetical protein
MGWGEPDRRRQRRPARPPGAPLADQLREKVEATGYADLTEAEYDRLDRDQLSYLDWDWLRLAREAADALDAQQARLDAAAADLGRFTQSTLGKIKALEACCAPLARMQIAQVLAYQRLTEVGHTTPEGHAITARLCLDLIDLLKDSPRCYITSAGTVLTEHDLDAMVTPTAATHRTLVAHIPKGVTLPQRRHAAPGYGWECSCGAASYGYQRHDDAAANAQQHEATAPTEGHTLMASPYDTADDL